MSAASGCACSDRIAFVDNGLVLSQTAVGRAAREKVQAGAAEQQAKLKDLEQQIQVLRSLREKSNDQAAIDKELAERLAAYQQAAQEAQQALQRLESETMAPAYKTINDAIKEYGKLHGYRLILGATPQGSIVYGDEAADITAEVVAFIDARGSAHEQ